MEKHTKARARLAAELWEKRDHSGLARLVSGAKTGDSADVLYYAGLAYNALNQRREAVQCWQKAIQKEPGHERACRALAYEIAEEQPVDAAEILYRLFAVGVADADDLTTLAEIRIKQDRLGEAQRLLERALEMEKENSLALLSMARLYTQVKSRDLALEYLRRTVETEDMDISVLASDAQFASLWDDAEFKMLVSAEDSRRSRSHRSRSSA